MVNIKHLVLVLNMQGSAQEAPLGRREEGLKGRAAAEVDPTEQHLRASAIKSGLVMVQPRR